MVDGDNVSGLAKGAVVLLFKKWGGRRGITVLKHLRKVLFREVEKGLQPIVEPLIQEEQQMSSTPYIE